MYQTMTMTTKSTSPDSWSRPNGRSLSAVFANTSIAVKVLAPFEAALFGIASPGPTTTTAPADTLRTPEAELAELLMTKTARTPLDGSLTETTTPERRREEQFPEIGRMPVKTPRLSSSSSHSARFSYSCRNSLDTQGHQYNKI